MNSLGFITMVQPHASAGATFQALDVFEYQSLEEFVQGYAPHLNGVVPWNAVDAPR